MSILKVYNPVDIEVDHGDGVYLYSADGTRYLDFTSGIGVMCLGHSHPALVNELKKQGDKVWHCSNLFKIKSQKVVADKLVSNSFASNVFFCNSGSEATEASIKIARKYFYEKGQKKKNRIITFEGAFHGRTFAALSAQKNRKYSEGFTPLLSGFKNIPFNDEKALKKNINENTAAILIEPIQGEGGIKPASLSFLKFIKDLCEKNNILLFLDEVQSGFGRSGKLYSHEWANINPDILATAKGIGSGFPMGACLATNKVSIGMTKGKHGSTYGGNPLAVSVGREVLRIISNKKFLKNVDIISRYLWKNLKKLENDFNEIVEVRGAGLLLGIKTRANNVMISDKLKKNKLLNVPAGDNIIRLAPPLIITKKHVDEAINIINETFKKL